MSSAKECATALTSPERVRSARLASGMPTDPTAVPTTSACSLVMPTNGFSVQLGPSTTSTLSRARRRLSPTTVITGARHRHLVQLQR